MKNKLAVLLTLILATTTTFGGYSSSTGSSGGGRSSSSSSSGFGKSSNSGSTWGKSSTTPSAPKTTTPTDTKPTWGKSDANAVKPKSSSDASKTLTQKQSMTPVKPKADYVKEFKQKNADKYVSKFPTEPAKRPDYIPPTANVGGNTYNINYNHQYGGYGYMDALGTFILFDAVSHMAEHSYQREIVYAPNTVVVEQSGGFLTGLWWTIKFIFGIIILAILVFFIVSFFQNRNI